MSIALTAEEQYLAAFDKTRKIVLHPPPKPDQDLIEERGSIANDAHNDICLPGGNPAIRSRRIVSGAQYACKSRILFAIFHSPRALI